MFGDDPAPLFRKSNIIPISRIVYHGYRLKHRPSTWWESRNFKSGRGL